MIVLVELKKLICGKMQMMLLFWMSSRPIILSWMGLSFTDWITSHHSIGNCLQTLSFYTIFTNLFQFNKYDRWNWSKNSHVTLWKSTNKCTDKHTDAQDTIVWIQHGPEVRHLWYCRKSTSRPKSGEDWKNRASRSEKKTEKASSLLI